MSKVTGLELAEFAKSKLGTPYVYGMKGEKLTTSKLEELHKLYPSSLDYNLAKKHIGEVCTDCSGLISWFTKKYLSSTGLKTSAKECYHIGDIKDSPIGTIVWKSGHVGVYVGRDSDNNYSIVEAMGAKYGTVQTNVMNRMFTNYLIEPFISYPSEVKVKRKLILYKSNFDTATKLVSIDCGENVFYHKDMKNGWSMVEYDGYLGYVKNSGLKKTKLSKYKTATALKKIYIRSSNTSKVKKDNVIQTFPEGTKIQKVIAKRGKWYYVSVDNVKGWVFGGKIKIKK